MNVETSFARIHAFLAVSGLVLTAWVADATGLLELLPITALVATVVTGLLAVVNRKLRFLFCLWIPAFIVCTFATFAVFTGYPLVPAIAAFVGVVYLVVSRLFFRFMDSVSKRKPA